MHQNGDNLFQLALNCFCQVCGAVVTAMNVADLDSAMTDDDEENRKILLIVP